MLQLIQNFLGFDAILLTAGKPLGLETFSLGIDLMHPPLISLAVFGAIIWEIEASERRKNILHEFN
jgi:hypothetical protein